LSAVTDDNDMLHFVTTMVCVAVNGQPTIGVIHKPFANNDKGETCKYRPVMEPSLDTILELCPHQLSIQVMHI